MLSDCEFFPVCQFASFMQQPDARHEQVAKFLLQFNSDEAMPATLRKSNEGKAELHLRTDELRDALWAAADSRRDAALAERKAIAEDGWVKQAAASVTTLHAELVQLVRKKP
jgi:hypothetical protein